eukprot:TRINITY_DN10123_c0_g3_i1.p1 TRINITY_DN10123_c0_g3~~TRINITY_DN10123_c0_g3_i1.p1  ORF type:complete len:159 (+),score=20.69 TRINITY_DN10123_c0_g3_i1:171-647(+)
MAANVVVPSDITLLEEKKSIGARKMSWLESIGLLGMSPTIHIHYSKLDKADRRAILTKKYDEDDKSEAGQIVKRRQAAVSKEVVSHNFLWLTSGAMTGACWWSFRRYNYQSRLVALPFIFYAGTFVGRAVGDIVTGRNGQYARDSFLGSLPGKVYYTA